MERTTSLVEQLKAIELALGAEERVRARDLLIAIRDAGESAPAGLAQQIDALASPDADLRAAAEWVEGALFEQSLSADLAGDSDWLDFEELGSDEAGEARASSGSADLSAARGAGEVDLEAWDQLDDLDEFGDFDGFDLDDDDFGGGANDASGPGQGSDPGAGFDERVESNARTRVPGDWYEESTRRIDPAALAGPPPADSSGSSDAPSADPFAGLNLFGDSEEEEVSSVAEQKAEDADARKERARGLSGMFKLPPPTATGVEPVSNPQGPDEQEEDGGIRETKQYAAASRQEDREPTSVRTDALPEEPAEREPLNPRDRPRFESGPSVARYAGVEPPPPSHRLRQSSPPQVDFELTAESPEEDDDLDFDLGFNPPPGVDSRLGPPSEAAMSGGDDSGFDLGLNNPEATRRTGTVPKAGAVEEAEPGDDELDFDLGFSNPARPAEPARSGGVTRNTPSLERSSDSQEPPSMARGARQERQTPISQVPAVSRGASASVDEDEFFALAESLAAESSGATDHPYRGEPVVRERPARTPSGETFDVEKEQAANAFAHDAPTGVRHAFVESSFVLEELPPGAAEGQDANMAAILLEARRLYENGALADSLSIVEKVLSRARSNEEAQELRGSIVREMERDLLDSLGSMSRVPRLAVELGALASLDLDHRAGYLLSQVDGMMSYEDIIELSGMPRLETMQVLVDLIEKGVLSDD